MREAKNANKRAIKRQHSHIPVRSYFEDILSERKRLEFRIAQPYYVKSSIDVLDEVRAYGAREIISDIPEALGMNHSLNNKAVAESPKHYCYFVLDFKPSPRKIQWRERNAQIIIKDWML
ncbi:2763_t:CDS:2 [Acaulospora morrowiae]|uniref:2763_t:CDS:1 n=1 Tax=Acaulospora morrowiae TaxID=94023 RepID=A0A9N8V5Q3_9GLOM|nr:2763_t:CDS:2 [Acaulospora morrowiae]